MQKNDGAPGFRVETSQGAIDARFVVAATGPFQVPVIPPIVPADAGVTQLHSAGLSQPGAAPGLAASSWSAPGPPACRSPPSCEQSGRRVYLSVGPHDRPPRRYRGRDNVWWLGVLGKWDAATPPEGAEHVTIAVSGADGGHTVDFRDLAGQGIILLGSTRSFRDGSVRFAADLRDNIAAGDANYLSVLDEADAYIALNGLNLPEEPDARVFGPEPGCVTSPVLELDLAAAGVTSIIWATGYATDFGWLKVDAFDPSGRPRHQRGVSSEPGVYFLGLPWLSRRGSSFIWGVWHDAKYIADQIVIQRGYAAHGD